ncbi:hypothetical protein ACG7TL_003470 [Trametes sanguinea]
MAQPSVSKFSGPTRSRQHKARGNDAKPYNRTQAAGLAHTSASKKSAPKTSAVPPVQSSSRSNLTLHDWLTVVDYFDTHRPITQAEIVKHFRTRTEGALIFDQASLSRHLSAKGRQADQARLNETPMALNTKRVRAVTRPDVEKALYLWFKHMETKGEHVSGAMLVEKRAAFEEQLGVPKEQRLASDGWVLKFCKAYGIRDYRRHGEAGSVNLEAVEKERDRIREICKLYKPEDIFNFDESGLFGFARPDRGLAAQQMAGKKSSKARITVAFMCNSTGTEKLPVFYIGKYKLPRCFGKTGPNERGFYYRNNKTAWMTSTLFEEWLKAQDREFRRQSRNILLWVDNFSGHEIEYIPTNIRLEFFEPNMTSFVQPLDAGIIRCFKAYYRKALCSRALMMDDAGEEDIYKINLLEVMVLVKDAWDKVGVETIHNCWQKAFALKNPPATSRGTLQPLQDPSAWAIIEGFAAGTMGTLPEAESQLRAHLGSRFQAADWKPMFDAIFATEDDDASAIIKIASLRAATLNSLSAGAATETPMAEPTSDIAELARTGEELMEEVDKLRERRRVRGARPSLEDLLNPVEEVEIGGASCMFPGGDEEIIAAVRASVSQKEDKDSDEDSDEEPITEISAREGVAICQQMERLCMQWFGKVEQDLSQLQGQVRRLRGALQREEEKSKRQATLSSLWQKTATESLSPAEV